MASQKRCSLWTPWLVTALTVIACKKFVSLIVCKLVAENFYRSGITEWLVSCDRLRNLFDYFALLNFVKVSNVIFKNIV